MIPAIVLPPPTGPYPVATTVWHLTDSARPDPVNAKWRREVMVQIWYPAQTSVGNKAPYFTDARLIDALAKENYYRQEPDLILSWRTIRTHSVLDGKPRKSGHFPILLCEPGLGIARSNYTILCEELASKGYAVAAIDPPHGGETILPDGRRFSAGDDPINAMDARFGEKVREWAGDMRFVLDEMARHSRREGDPFFGRFDWSKVGAFGHSMGGAAAVDAGCLDARIKATVDMDGLPADEPVKSGPATPTVILRSNPNYNDADFARQGRTRAQWEAMGAQGRKVWDEFESKVKHPFYVVSIRDTGHLSFSDAPYVMPSTITHFSDHALPKERTVSLVGKYLAGFFDLVLRGKRFPALDSAKGREAEVQVRKLGS